MSEGGAHSYPGDRKKRIALFCQRVSVLVPSSDSLVDKSVPDECIGIDHVPPVNNHRTGSFAELFDRERIEGTVLGMAR